MALTRTRSGLVSSDNFPVNGALPSPWEVLTSANITSGRIRAPSSGSASNRPGARWKIDAEASTECFTQVEGQFSNASGTNGVQHAHYALTARTGYGLHMDPPDTGLNRWTANTPVGLDTAATSTRSTGVMYLTQLYTAPGVQEGFAEADAGATRTVSDNDTVHDAVLRVPVFHRNNSLTSSSNVQYDNALWMRSKYVTVTLLGTATPGWKAKVYNASDTLILEATESSNVATLDFSRYSGFADEIPSPTDDDDPDTGGWAYIIVESAVGIELDRYDEHTVYPGDTYSWETGSSGGGGASTTTPAPEPPVSTSGINRLGPDDVLFHQDFRGGGLFHGLFTRSAGAWHWTADTKQFERRVQNQRRTEFVILEWPEFDRTILTAGLLLEPTTSQKISQPFDFSAWSSPQSASVEITVVMAAAGWTTTRGDGAMTVSPVMAGTGMTTITASGAMTVEVFPEGTGLVGGIGPGAMDIAPTLAGTGAVS